MKCFRLEIVSIERVIQEDGYFDKDCSTFLISRDMWKEILYSGNLAGTLAIMNSRVEVTCDVCGSFMLPAGPFLEFVQKTEAFEKGNEYFSEIARENLRHIFQSLIETKFNDEDAFWKYWTDEGCVYNLLKDGNGELVIDENTSLAYDDVVVKISSGSCSSCESLFQRD